MSYEDVLIREATTDPTQQEIDEREETVILDTGDESTNESTETGEASLPPAVMVGAVDEYWKSKVGRCLGCSTEIAVDESYCPACESFLIEAHQTPNPLT